MLNFISTLSYRSKVHQFELPTPMLDQAGYALWDGSIVWTSDDDKWPVGLHGKNLTDKEYTVSGDNLLRTNPDTGEFHLLDGSPGFSRQEACSGGKEGDYTVRARWSQ